MTDLIGASRGYDCEDEGCPFHGKAHWHERPVEGNDVVIVPNGDPMTFGYTNWKGEYSVRLVYPVHFWYGSTEWHREETYLMQAYDLDKMAMRDFALSHMAGEKVGEDLNLPIETSRDPNGAAGATEAAPRR